MLNRVPLWAGQGHIFHGFTLWIKHCIRMYIYTDRQDEHRHFLSCSSQLKMTLIFGSNVITGPNSNKNKKYTHFERQCSMCMCKCLLKWIPHFIIYKCLSKWRQWLLLSWLVNSAQSLDMISISSTSTSLYSPPAFPGLSLQQLDSKQIAETWPVSIAEESFIGQLMWHLPPLT